MSMCYNSEFAVACTDGFGSSWLSRGGSRLRPVGIVGHRHPGRSMTITVDKQIGKRDVRRAARRPPRHPARLDVTRMGSMAEADKAAFNIDDRSQPRCKATAPKNGAEFYVEP